MYKILYTPAGASQGARRAPEVEQLSTADEPFYHPLINKLNKQLRDPKKDQ
jgi:hypothetical protein